MRAMASVDPPVANGATMVIGRFGQSCALACCAKTIAAAARARNAFTDPRPFMPTCGFSLAARLLRFARNDNTCIQSVVIARSAQRDEAISTTRTGASVANGFYYSALMPEARMTFDHFA